MQKTFPLYPDGQLHSIQELEQRLQFCYLPHNAFTTPEEQQEVYAKGMAKYQNREISQEAQELGSRFIQEIETGYIPSVSVRWINEHIGYGLFAEEDLEKGSYAGEYTGVVRKNNRRYIEPLNDYCYEYPVPDEIGRSFVIDATSGNLTRFINHSSTPNLQPLHAFYKGFYHLIFLASSNIIRGSQLSYDYGASYWYIRDQPTAQLLPFT